MELSLIKKHNLQVNFSKFKCLTASDAEVFEFIAKEGAKITQSIIKDLDFPEEAKIGGIIRGNNGYVANGLTQIHEGDRVVVFTLPAGIKKIEKFFK